MEFDTTVKQPRCQWPTTVMQEQNYSSPESTEINETSVKHA